MAFYDVTAKFEVEADSQESAEQDANSNLTRISTGEWDVESVVLSADQGDEDPEAYVETANILADPEAMAAIAEARSEGSS